MEESSPGRDSRGLRTTNVPWPRFCGLGIRVRLSRVGLAESREVADRKVTRPVPSEGSAGASGCNSGLIPRLSRGLGCSLRGRGKGHLGVLTAWHCSQPWERAFYDQSQQSCVTTSTTFYSLRATHEVQHALRPGSWIPPWNHLCVSVKTKPLAAKNVGARAPSQCGSSWSRGPQFHHTRFIS